MRPLLMTMLSGLLLVACSRSAPEHQPEQRPESRALWRVHRVETDRAVKCLDRALDSVLATASTEAAEGDDELAGRVREATYLRAALSRELHGGRVARGAQADERRQRIDALIDDIESLTGATSCA